MLFQKIGWSKCGAKLPSLTTKLPLIPRGRSSLLKQKRTAKATFPIVGVSDVINTFRTLTISITVTEGKVQFESFSVNSSTCFFENDKILRSVMLPVNNSEADLVRLLNGRYTREELVFNKLWSQAVAAEARFNSAINSAYLRLKQYGVAYDDLEKFVKEKSDLNIK